jgi:hypothetical protein
MSKFKKKMPKKPGLAEALKQVTTLDKRDCQEYVSRCPSKQYSLAFRILN